MLRESLNTLAEAFGTHVSGGTIPNAEGVKQTAIMLSDLVRSIDQLRSNQPIPLGSNSGELIVSALLHEDLADLAGWFSRSARQDIPVVMDREALAMFSLAIHNMSARAVAMERLLGLKGTKPTADTAGGVVPIASRRSIDQLLQQAGWQPCDPPNGGAAA